MPAKRKITLELIYAKLLKHDRQFEGLTKMIFEVEDRLKAEIATVLERVRNLETIVEKMSGDLERLQQEYFALTQAVKRIEKTLEARSIRDEQFDTVLIRLDRIERHLGLVPETAR
jgi:hypothetical protein